MTWLLYDTTRTWHVSCMIWLICDMTQMWHDSDLTWRMCGRAVRYWWHPRYAYVTWLSCVYHAWHDSYAIWIRCDITPMWHDPYVTWYTYVTWLRCDMTHMWHDSYVLICDIASTWHDSTVTLVDPCGIDDTRGDQIWYGLFVTRLIRHTRATWLKCDMTRDTGQVGAVLTALAAAFGCVCSFLFARVFPYIKSSCGCWVGLPVFLVKVRKIQCTVRIPFIRSSCGFKIQILSGNDEKRMNICLEEVDKQMGMSPSK